MPKRKLKIPLLLYLALEYFHVHTNFAINAKEKQKNISNLNRLVILKRSVKKNDTLLYVREAS